MPYLGIHTLNLNRLKRKLGREIEEIDLYRSLLSPEYLSESIFLDSLYRKADLTVLKIKRLENLLRTTR